MNVERGLVQRQGWGGVRGHRERMRGTAMEMHNVYACDQRPNSIKTDKQTNKKIQNQNRPRAMSPDKHLEKEKTIDLLSLYFLTKKKKTFQEN